MKEIITKTKTLKRIALLTGLLIIMAFMVYFNYFTKTWKEPTWQTLVDEADISIFGIMGVADNDFKKILTLKPGVVQLPGSVTSEELELAFGQAKSLDLKLAARGPGKNHLQKSGSKIDLTKLKTVVDSVFTSTKVAGDPDFLYYYLIDEPCHQDKWDINSEDFKKIYKTVKSVNPKIKIFVNFGNLSCLQSYLPDNCSDWPITDLAGFTITQSKIKKADREGINYINEADQIAAQVKKCDPDLRIVPLIAVYEYPAKKADLPTPQWIQKTGLEVLEYDNFDGIMFYPWNPSSYMGKTIKDIANDPAYIKAFQTVFRNIQ